MIEPEPIIEVGLAGAGGSSGQSRSVGIGEFTREWSVRVDAEGEALLHDLPTGIKLRCEAIDDAGRLVGISGQFRLRPAERKDLNIRLAKAMDVAIELEDQEGNPIAWTVIVAFPVQPTDVQQAGHRKWYRELDVRHAPLGGVTNAHGGAILRGIPVGEWWIGVVSPRTGESPEETAIPKIAQLLTVQVTQPPRTGPA